MEDVCDLSHLLQSEHNAKEQLEKSLSEMDSTLEIETRRLQQESDSCQDMIKRKAELRLRIQHSCEIMEISMARLEQSTKDIKECNSHLIVPKVEEHIKRKNEIQNDIEVSQSKIAFIESQLTEQFLAEYSTLCTNVKTLRASNASMSLELSKLKEQETSLQKSRSVLDNQIASQSHEVSSGREKLTSLGAQLDEKKQTVLLGCERLRQFKTTSFEENCMAENDLKAAQEIHEATMSEVKYLTEQICTETGKLVNATDCHNIIENKRLEILQSLSTLKKEEEAMLTQIKENESNIQTEQAEAAMLNNALAVTNSSINAQQTMKASNDNQVMCSVMDSNVDDEVLQLNADLVETERLLQQVQTQLDSNSNPELLEVLAKVHEANALQAEMCADLEEARSCIKDLNRAMQQKEKAVADQTARLEDILAEHSAQTARNRTAANSLNELQKKVSDLRESVHSEDTAQATSSSSSSSSSSSNLAQLRDIINTEQALVHEKENALISSKHHTVELLQEQKARREEHHQSVLAAEKDKRLTKKKRVLQEVHEADINVERNRLESVGKAYSEDAKNKEQIFLQEKTQLEKEHARLLSTKTKSGSTTTTSATKSNRSSKIRGRSIVTRSKKGK